MDTAFSGHAAGLQSIATNRVRMATGHLARRTEAVQWDVTGTERPTFPPPMSGPGWTLPASKYVIGQPRTGFERIEPRVAPSKPECTLPPVAVLEHVAETGDQRYMSYPSVDMKAMRGLPMDAKVEQQSSSSSSSPMTGPLTPSSVPSMNFSRESTQRRSESPVLREPARVSKRQKRHSAKSAEDVQLGTWTSNTLDKYRRPWMTEREVQPPTRAKISPAARNPKEKHNKAQSVLRLDKGAEKIILQRLLMTLGFRGARLQSKTNARSSGLIFEEVELLQGACQALSLTNIICRELFGEEGMQQLGACLQFFEPDDSIKAMLEQARPEESLLKGKSDDEKKKLMKSFLEPVKVELMERADQPLGLKMAPRDQDVNRLIQEKLVPIANPVGRELFGLMCKKPEHRL